MGFFSSRRTDGDFVVHDREGTKAATTVVKVIRSRFYGKHKTGAERTTTGDESSTYIPQDGTTASILGHPGQTLRKSQSTPFATTIRKTSGPSRLKNTFTSSSVNLRSTDTTKTKVPSVLKSSEPHVQEDPSISNFTYGRPDASATFATESATKSVSAPSTPVGIRTSRTDNATMTLAQRLNELAVANDEGLLNDDEYRVLRQNLFERFAGNTTIPTEESVVPASVTVLRRPQKGNTTNPESRASFSSSRLSSNFNVDIVPNSSSFSTRSPSIRSVKTGVASLLHRATNRGSNRDKSDTSSIYSIASTASNAFHTQSPQYHPHTRVGSQTGSIRSLRKKKSNSSIGTEASVSKNSPADAISLLSRTSRNRAGLDFGQHPERSPSDGYSPQLPPRSATSSLRKLAVPPSSFSPKGLHGSNLESVGKKDKAQDIYDDSNLVTSADIKREILAVEAEGRRLVDAFNGLEVTTLAKRHRRHLGHHRVESRPATIVGLPGDGTTESGETGIGGGASSSASAGVGIGSSWTLIPDNKLHFRATPAQTPTSAYLDTDGISIRSGTSAHTSHTGRSIPRSAHRDASRALPSKPSSGSVSGSGAGSLHRKNSSSSLASSTAAAKKRMGGGSGLSPGPPAVPPLPSSLIGLSPVALASGSSLNLARSTGHLPMSSVPEDENVDHVGLGPGSEEMDEEIRAIRKKKQDVSRRYEERLEYLRAKLKGAQLHEKLMKK
ncbi:hypothetical protein FB446DRAFT_707654 [Lentinula raphanica]|nr:hypothetical protein FB446DRAFT_707654 [Lentinula raphanica]